LLFKVLNELPRSLRKANPAVPGDVELLVLRELCKDPSKRSQSAAEMLESFKWLAAYEKRDSGLSLLGTKIRNKVASGSLGERKDSGTSSASRVLSQIANRTPSAWAKTVAQSRTRKAILFGLAIVAALVIGIVIAVVLARKTGIAAVPVSASAAPISATAPQANRQIVEIHVVGAPVEAQILYDGAVVPENPFRVESKAALVKIEVQATGYEPFATMITPTKNTEVKVSLKRENKKNRANPLRDATVLPEKSKVNFKKGKRGTKFGKDFE
jgi:serine/threonine protein kinase